MDKGRDVCFVEGVEGRDDGVGSGRQVGMGWSMDGCWMLFGFGIGQDIVEEDGDGGS